MRKLFRRLPDRNKKWAAAEEVPTLPIPKEALEKDTELQDQSAESLTAAFLVGCAQSPGKVREQNEDALFSLSTVIANDNYHLPLGVFIVADGMGGHNQGEVASKVAVRVSARLILQVLFLPLLVAQTQPTQLPIQDVLKNCVLEAHQAILNEAPGSGTTLSIAVMLYNNLYTSHVGDSRVYLIRSTGRLKAITRDHSLVNRMLELGKLTPEEAEHHPQRNVLYRALGQKTPPEPELRRMTLEDYSHVLLCSDGLWGSMTEDEIAKVVTSIDSPQTAAQKLIEEANAHGGQDNITSIVIKLPRNTSA